MFHHRLFGCTIDRTSRNLSQGKGPKILIIDIFDGSKFSMIRHFRELRFSEPWQKRDVALNARNCADEIVMHNINIEEDGGLLPALQKYMKMIVIPQINKYDKWGSLMENKQGKQILPSIHPHSNITFNLISSLPSSLFHLHPKFPQFYPQLNLTLILCTGVKKLKSKNFGLFWTHEIFEFLSPQQLSSQLVWNWVIDWKWDGLNLNLEKLFFTNVKLFLDSVKVL